MYDFIYEYSRARAIEDGFLVDVSTLAREHGWKWPVALTKDLYAAISDIPVGVSDDLQGRLRDLLFMTMLNAKKNSSGERIIYTKIECPYLKAVASDQKITQFLEVKVEAGPGDDYEPVITMDIV